MVLLAIALICGLVAVMVLFFEAGYRIGLRRWARVPQTRRTLSGTLAGSVFALMGLLIAFTIYGAGTRYDNRRNLTGQESNAIGTAYLRLDLLPPETQPELRENFRKYLRSRLAVYHAIPDIEAVNAALERSSALQQVIWRKVVEALKGGGPAEKSLVLTSLNEMIDITTVRTVAEMTHTPTPVFAMLILTVFASSSLAGYTMSASETRDWVSVIAFACVLGAALYTIIDYEYPRIGLVRIDPVDEVLVQTLKQMK